MLFRSPATQIALHRAQGAQSSSEGNLAELIEAAVVKRDVYSICDGLRVLFEQCKQASVMGSGMHNHSCSPQLLRVVACSLEWYVPFDSINTQACTLSYEKMQGVCIFKLY